MTEATSGEALATVGPEAVWRVLADGPRWFEWNEAVEWLWFEAGVRAGALATMKPKRFRQTAFLITAADEPRELAMQITVGPAARLAFRWTLAADGEGTRITETVTTGGFAARWLFAAAAQRSIAAMPERLARLAALAAEKNHATGTGRVITNE
jgi:hypothetical protein